MIKTDDLKVFISNRDSTCDECHEEHDARRQVQARMQEVLAEWEAPGVSRGP